MKKKNILRYKGYIGSIEVSLEDNCLHGELLYTNDTVTYEANSVDDLKKEFEEAVDDYLSTCHELDKEPDKPFSGSFNVRLGQELHRDAAIQAKLEGVFLNEFVKEAVKEKISREEKRIHLYHHHNIVVRDKMSASTEFPSIKEKKGWDKTQFVQ